MFNSHQNIPKKNVFISQYFLTCCFLDQVLFYMCCNYQDQTVLLSAGLKVKVRHRDNQQALNHTEHVLKVVEQIPENFLCILLKLMPCTSDSCLDVRQGMWCKGYGAKCIRKNRHLLFASADLEKSFHRSNRKFLQQALLKAWIVWVGYIFRADELKKEVR